MLLGRATPESLDGARQKRTESGPPLTRYALQPSPYEKSLANHEHLYLLPTNWFAPLSKGTAASPSFFPTASRPQSSCFPISRLNRRKKFRSTVSRCQSNTTAPCNSSLSKRKKSPGRSS
jgi:hypothetical protein